MVADDVLVRTFLRQSSPTIDDRLLGSSTMVGNRRRSLKIHVLINFKHCKSMIADGLQHMRTWFKGIAEDNGSLMRPLSNIIYETKSVPKQKVYLLSVFSK